MIKYKLLFYGLAILVLVYSGIVIQRDYLHTCPVPEVRVDSTSIDVGIIDDSIGYEPQIIRIRVPANEDSIYQAAKIWWQSQIKPDTTKPETANGHLYIASKDTVYKDSTLQANIQFNSRIVLDPEAHFNLKFKVRERTITETVYKTETITYNPYFFIEGGFCAGNTFNYYLSAGVNLVSYRHLKVPVYYELEHIPDGVTTHSMRVGTRIEF